MSSTIFKISAHTQFITQDPNYLSFRKGQAFYVLSTNFEQNYFFVSTHYATPFARNAVSGLVPLDHFFVVDMNTNKKIALPAQIKELLKTFPRRLSENDKSTASMLATKTQTQLCINDSPQSNEEDSLSETSSTSLLEPESNHIPANQSTPQKSQFSSDIKLSATYEKIALDGIITAQLHPFNFQKISDPSKDYVYPIRVSRNNCTHTIFRTFNHFQQLHQAILTVYPEFSSRFIATKVSNPLELYQARILVPRIRQQHYELSKYLSYLFNAPLEIRELPVFDSFFEPKIQAELQFVHFLRRDSKLDL